MYMYVEQVKVACHTKDHIIILEAMGWFGNWDHKMANVSETSIGLGSKIYFKTRKKNNTSRELGFLIPKQQISQKPKLTLSGTKVFGTKMKKCMIWYGFQDN